jgi:endonuclease/exonuclease/phosphatase family metal-dependent hydrolase
VRLVSTLVLAVSVTAAALARQAPPSRRSIAPPLSDRLDHSPFTPCAKPPANHAHARIASWNIKAARAAPLDALISEMRAMQADIIALQEVDVQTRRSGNVDQPKAIAAALGFHYAFAASIEWDGGDYGLALLSKWPLVTVERHRVGPADLDEPRIVLDATICLRGADNGHATGSAGRPLRLLNHHADDHQAVRALGFVDLTRITQTAIGRGLLMVGDMNEGAQGAGIRALGDIGLVDLGATAAVSTTASGRIDYAFADRPLSRQVSGVRVWPTHNSDHHAVLIDLDW